MAARARREKMIIISQKIGRAHARVRRANADRFCRVACAVVHEEANLPVELKRKLTQLRELDAQSQELFERMSKLSKNHILRAKKSVQEGREPDEEYLVKARRSTPSRVVVHRREPVVDHAHHVPLDARQIRPLWKRERGRGRNPQ